MDSLTPVWFARDRSIAVDRPIVMGIVNVTPDSFSDGGEHLTTESALERVERMVADGVDIVDIGGESTRPGATPLLEEEELERVLPVIRGITREHPSLLVSIDTMKSGVAERALEAGCSIVNDVTGLRHDARLASVVARAGAGVVLMHSRGKAGELASYDHANYDGDVVGAVERELLESVARASADGVRREHIVIDPGIGFAKRTDDSLAVLRAIPRLAGLGFPLLIGASRKRVVASLAEHVGRAPLAPAERLFGSVGVHVAALSLGARIFRVHDVRAHREALDAAWHIVAAEAERSSGMGEGA